MVGNYNGCQVEAAVSPHTPLPTFLTMTVSEPYHVLTKIVIGWELTLKPHGNVLFFKQSADLKHCKIRKPTELKKV